jgi:membrane associated rhomboid family serine protease
MNRPPAAVSFAFPKPKRALWIVMIAMFALGIFTALLGTWVGPSGSLVFEALGYKPGHTLARPWALLTSGLLTDPEHWSHLALSLLGLYFLGASLEQRWGSWRFARFLAFSVIIGNLTVLAVSLVVPLAAAAPADPSGPTVEASYVTAQFGLSSAALLRFHPGFVFGPTAAVTAIAVAWSREFAQSTVNLFFFFPVRGRVLFWVTIGFCVLNLIYPALLPEGVVAPFGGVIAGLLLGGTPSLARTAWLHLRLALLRRRTTNLNVDDVLSPKPKRRPRAGAPPLRVVPGGLEEVLKKRNPPKDKRYLN